MKGPERRRRWGAWSQIVPLVLLLGVPMACGHKQPPTVMVITPTGGLEYWEKFDHTVRASAEAAGIHTELAAPQSVTDYTEQAQMVENAVARKVQGIIVSPAHQLVLASVLQKAVRAHIPVVVVGTPIALSEKEFAAFIGWDEAEAGRLAARRFISVLQNGGEVGIVGVSPTAEGSSLIERAFAEEIARAPRVKLVGVKYGLSDWARGHQAVLDLLAEHPQIKGIFTTDEFATHAAASALQKRGKKRSLLIGVSDEGLEVAGIRNGDVDALVLSDPHELGSRAMQAMRAALSGSDARTYSTRLPVTLIDTSNVRTSPLVASLFK